MFRNASSHVSLRNIGSGDCAIRLHTHPRTPEPLVQLWRDKTSMRNFLVLGASGLIGQAVAADLMQRGLQVTAAARRLTTAQRDLFGDNARETPIADLDAAQLKQLIAESGADVVVNCLGLLQDQPGKSTQDVHEGFVTRLIDALRDAGKPVLLIRSPFPAIRPMTAHPSP